MKKTKKEIREYQKEYRNRPENKKKMKEYCATDEHREYMRLYQIKNRSRPGYGDKNNEYQRIYRKNKKNKGMKTLKLTPEELNELAAKLANEIHDYKDQMSEELYNTFIKV